MTQTVAILHISRPDWHIGVQWLAWARWLASQPTAAPYPLIVFVAKAIDPACLQTIHNVIGNWSDARVVQNPSSDERTDMGYAYLANLAFRNALECTERLFPGHPTLWVEADCIPLRPSWMREIDEEYFRRGKPFLGDFHALGPIPHLTGNAVYPSDWRKKAPSISELPKPNPAQGFDTLCAHETVPQSAKSIRIQQAWDQPARHFTDNNLGVIHPDTCLFHRCKDGSLIEVLSRRMKAPKIFLPLPLQKPTPTRVHRLLSRQATTG